jgi:hypothetical protein
MWVTPTAYVTKLDGDWHMVDCATEEEHTAPLLGELPLSKEQHVRVFAQAKRECVWLQPGDAARRRKMRENSQNEVECG